MLKTLSSILFSCFVLSAAAQSESTDRKFSVGVTFSPDYSYRTLGEGKGAYKSLVEEMKKTGAAQFGFTTGATLIYHVSEKVNIETGLYYAIKKHQSSKLPGVGTKGIFIGEVTSEKEFEYLDFPVKVNYALLKQEKLNLSITGGASFNFFRDGKVITTTHYSDGKSTEQTEKISKSFVNNLDIAGIVGFAIDYQLHDKIALRAEPIFRHSILPISNNTDIKEYLFSVGTNVSVFYHF